jgi:hypothetical protein
LALQEARLEPSGAKLGVLKDLPVQRQRRLDAENLVVGKRASGPRQCLVAVDAPRAQLREK